MIRRFQCTEGPTYEEDIDFELTVIAYIDGLDGDLRARHPKRRNGRTEEGTDPPKKLPQKQILNRETHCQSSPHLRIDHMDVSTEGERDSLLRDVNSNTSDDVGGVPDYGIQNDETLLGRRDTDNWEFAGYGAEVLVDNLVVDEVAFEAAKAQKKKHALGQLVSTAISGTLEHSVSLYLDSSFI